MPSRLAHRLQHAIAYVRSHFQKLVLAESRRGDLPPVRVVMLNGKKRLDAPTVNYSFGTLHQILAEALARVDVRARRPRSVLLLGLGAGSVVHVLRREHGITAPIVAVELDPEVVRLGREHFGLGDHRDLEVVLGDALRFVTEDRRCFDLVVVDLFVDAVVPAPFRQRAFLAALRQRLAPQGLLVFNLVTDTPAGGKAMPQFVDEMRTVFPAAVAMAIRSNHVFVAERGIGTDPTPRVLAAP